MSDVRAYRRHLDKMLSVNHLFYDYACASSHPLI
jgi:hypothetical protein